MGEASWWRTREPWRTFLLLHVFSLTGSSALRLEGPAIQVSGFVDNLALAKDAAPVFARVSPNQSGVETGVMLEHVANQDVVMGLAVSTAGELRSLAGTFVRSLRSAGFEGKILLGVNPTLTEGEKQWCQRWNVTVMPVEESTSGVPYALRRFQLYSEWLTFSNSSGYVLCSDVRDVFFQKNPFDEFMRLGQAKNPNEPVIQVALEWGWDEPHDLLEKKRGSRIGDSDFNEGWIANCMGPSAAAAIGNRSVLCSGTTMGTHAGMETYFNMMRDAIAEWPHCKAFGVDQGFHNYVIYNHLISGRDSLLHVDMPPVASSEAVMLTVGVMCSPPPSMKGLTPPDHSYTGRLKQDSEGFALRDDGTRAAVVHQSDRCFNQFYRNGWLDKHFGDHLDRS